MATIEYYATGRRKTSTARVFLRPGTGTITVNHREFANYFPTEAQRVTVKRPLSLTETTDKFDILATVAGGGVTIFWTINQSDFIDEWLTRSEPEGIITSRSSLLFHRYQKIGVPPPPRDATPGEPAPGDGAPAVGAP